MKRVLIALDYDPTAHKVAETGYTLAKSMNAEVILLHIVSEISYYSSPEYSPIVGFTGMDTLGASALIDVESVVNASKDFLQKIKEHFKDDSAQIKVEEGDIAETILNTAKKSKADIIVLGTHSRKGIDKLLMGSVAEKILRHTSIPLFVIPIKK